MKKAVIIISTVLLLSLISGSIYLIYYISQQDIEKPKKGEYEEKINEKAGELFDSSGKEKKVELDSKKEATHLSKVMNTKNAYWIRRADLVWNDIEKKEGEFNWDLMDERVRESASDEMGETYNLSIIWPYANWDQDKCHEGDKYLATGHLKRGNEDLKMGAPCDMESYGDFVQKTVERYDGDGIDDMPDLKIPIKYWEIINEPSMQGGSEGGAGEDLKFFVGTPQEYLETLKTSYQAIKKADVEAKVLHAGMAGMMDQFLEFWDPIFEAGGGEYFDIANMHTISTREDREDLFMLRFNEYLKKYNLQDKPVWLTEVEFYGLMEKPDDIRAFEKLMVRSSVFALAQGAEKLFYIENWFFWDQPELLEGPKEEKPEEDIMEEKEKDKDMKNKLEENEEVLHSSTHKVYLNLINKLNDYDKIEIIKEEYIENEDDNAGATSKVGQYKFILGEKETYVLWGQADLPEELGGAVTVTNIYGDSEKKGVDEIVLSDEPIFVEKF